MASRPLPCRICSALSPQMDKRKVQRNRQLPRHFSFSSEGTAALPLALSACTKLLFLQGFLMKSAASLAES